MPGPLSLPNGRSRVEYTEMWDIVCDIHHKNDERVCTPDDHKMLDKYGDVIFHAWVTKREWLARRNKLRTGKTV